jgi:hypothetical protein
MEDLVFGNMKGQPRKMMIFEMAFSFEVLSDTEIFESILT